METKENNNTASTHQEKARKLKKLRRWQIVVSLLGIAILIWGIPIYSVNYSSGLPLFELQTDGNQ